MTVCAYCGRRTCCRAYRRRRARPPAVPKRLDWSETHPTILPCANGRFLAVSPPDAPVAIGVGYEVTEVAAREKFYAALAKWRSLLEAPRDHLTATRGTE